MCHYGNITVPCYWVLKGMRGADKKRSMRYGDMESVIKKNYRERNYAGKIDTDKTEIQRNIDHEKR